jgi:hypothetical protein
MSNVRKKPVVGMPSVEEDNATHGGKEKNRCILTPHPNGVGMK